MKKILYIAIASSFVLSLVVLPMVAMAGGPANKVTGDFVRLKGDGTNPNATAYECEISAHEVTEKRPQKGFMYCSCGDGNSWEIDFSNANTFVSVFEDGETALIGGMVTAAEGSQSSLLGKFVGFEIHDLGEPGAYNDWSVHAIFDTAEEFWGWSENGGGNHHYTVTEGNLQVHYHE